MNKQAGKAKLIAGHSTQWADEKALKKYYKKLDTVELEAWAEALKATYKPCPDSEPIHRMRVAMSILYHFFPRETKAKKTSKYASYSLVDLVSLASEHSIPYEATDDERILRMRVIMALRAAKVIE